MTAVSQRDHYVSQTYLAQFVGTAGTLVPYYKDGRVVAGTPKRPKSICTEVDGDLNTYFDDPRVLDKYLRPIETRWAANLVAFRERRLTRNEKYGLSAYIAYLRACNPVAKRLGQQMIAKAMQPLVDKTLMESLSNPKPGDPPLDAATREQLRHEVESGGVHALVDREYAHARGIASLSGGADRLYCSHWLKLCNETDIPFLTSDNPSVVYPHPKDDLNCSVFVPLSGVDAVLISPNDDLSRPTEAEVLAFECAGDVYASVKRDAVQRFNQLVVRSAERLVLHQANEEWISELVAANRTWRMEHALDSIPYGSGVLQIHRQRAVNVAGQAGANR